jgi:epoxide hydrolase-like protein
MSVTIENPAGATAVRPFAIPKVPGAELEALRARIAATRWPDKETVTDDSQGIPLAMLQELAQTLTGIADSPVGLAAWLLDHGDSYGQPAAPVTSAALGYTANGHPAGALTRDDVLDNIMLYWLTNTAISAARLYWENKISLYNAVSVFVPAAVSAFPGEGYQAPRSWTERAYHNLIYYNQPSQGGHFAAWEQPQIFSEEVRAGLRPLRN